MCAGRAIWWVFTRLSLCGYQPLCAVCGSNLAELNHSVFIVVPPCMADVATVDCALCRQLNKRTLLLCDSVEKIQHRDIPGICNAGLTRNHACLYRMAPIQMTLSDPKLTLPNWNLSPLPPKNTARINYDVCTRESEGILGLQFQLSYRRTSQGHWQSRIHNVNGNTR